MRTSELLPMAHLALSAVFLLWNILLAGRITGQRSLPRFLAGLTALGGLLIAPALLVLVASTSLITGRLVSTIGWIWPLTATLIAAQALYATAARLVSPLVGIPILAYDIVVAATALASYSLAQGDVTSGPLLTLSAGSASALATIGLGSAALSPLHAPVPLLSPAHPARWRLITGWRVAIALLAGAWAVLVAVELRRGARALSGYAAFADDELRLRPDDPFTVGLEILPPLSSPPLAMTLRNDLELVGDAELGAVLVTIAREGARNLALDSLRRALEPYRRDSLLLLLGIEPSNARDRVEPADGDSTYLANVTRAVARLRPDYLVVLEDPDNPDSRSRRASLPSLREWQLRALVNAARQASPRTRVALSVVPGTRDSALYAWAASGDSPLDAVGFAMLADAGGGPRLAARIRIAESWMQQAGVQKEHWVFRTGGIPSIHGDISQDHALNGLLGWAMGRPGIRGVIATHATDYGSMRGLRAATGRVRPATATLIRAGKEAR